MFAARFRRILAIAVVAGGSLALSAVPASAGIQHEAVVSCANANQGSVTPAREPVTASGAPQWSYSLYYVGDYRNPWVRTDWTAAYANAGYSPTYEHVNGAWRAVGPAGIDVSLPPHYGTAYVWELRYEQVGGQWSTQWVYAGSCTPPPGA